MQKNDGNSDNKTVTSGMTVMIIIPIIIMMIAMTVVIVIPRVYLVKVVVVVV